MKMEEEESQGWISWMWNWGAQPDTERKEVKTGGRLQIDMYMWNVFVVTACNISFSYSSYVRSIYSSYHLCIRV